MEAVGVLGGIRFDQTLEQTDVSTGLSYFEEDDVIVAKITPCFENGKCALAENVPGGRALGSTEFHVIRPGSGILPRFLFYAVVSEAFREPGKAQMHGAAGQKRVPTDFIKDFCLSFPDRAAQRVVAAFLDLQTSEIDALIAKKQRLIDLLDEKHDLLISRAVTGGLKLSAPVKNSGQPLLGDLPVHWCVKRTKFLFAYVTSGSRGWAEHYSETGPVFLRITNVTRDGIDLYTGGLQRVSVPEGSEGERTRASAGDLVISITAWVGAVGIVPEGLGEAYVSQHLALCRPNTDINPRWLAYALFALPMRCQFNQMMYGGTKVQLALGDVKNISVPVPPPDEQNAIATHLDALARNAQKVKSSILSAIDRLREYRSALITAAVTGQLDLREHEKKMGALV